MWGWTAGQQPNWRHFVPSQASRMIDVQRWVVNRRGGRFEAAWHAWWLHRAGPTPRLSLRCRPRYRAPSFDQSR